MTPKVGQKSSRVPIPLNLGDSHGATRQVGMALGVLLAHPVAAGPWFSRPLQDREGAETRGTSGHSAHSLLTASISVSPSSPEF